MDKSTDDVLSLKLKGVYTSKFKSLYSAFLHNTKLCGYKVRIKFDKDPLTVEHINWATKIVNTCFFLWFR